MHVPFPESRLGAHEGRDCGVFVKSEYKRVGRAKDPCVLELRNGSLLDAILNVNQIGAVGPGDDPAMPVNVESMKVATHPDHSKTHLGRTTRDQSGCVPQVLAPVDAHAGVAEGMKQLQVQRLVWWSAIEEAADPPEEAQFLVRFQQQVACLDEELQVGR